VAGSEPDPLVRIARGVERIATALELHVRQSAAAGPSAALVVKRPDGDRTGLGSANLLEPRIVVVHIANVGDAATTIHGPTLQWNEQVYSGNIELSDGRRSDTRRLVPNEQAVLFFDVPDEPVPNSPLELRVPFQPGEFPVGDVYVELLRYAGMAAGKPAWEPVAARTEPQRYAES